MKKRMHAIVLASTLLFTLLAACGNSNTNTTPTPSSTSQGSDQVETLTFTITASSAVSPGSPDAQMRDKFVELIEEYSGGAIKVERYADGSVCSTEREMVEAVQLGSMDMGYSSDMGIDSVIGGLGWAWLPYMITDYDGVDEYYKNGWIGEDLTAAMAKSGIVRLAYYENDFRVLGTDIETNCMADMSGQKVRVPEITELLRFYDLTGALSASVASSETLTALTQGTISAVDNTMINLQKFGLLGELDYIVPLNHMYSGSSVIANQNFWNGLTDAQKEVIQKAATDAADLQTELARAESQRLLSPEGEAEYGYKVLPVSEEFDTQLKEVAKQLWDEFAEDYDAAEMEKVIRYFN